VGQQRAVAWRTGRCCLSVSPDTITSNAPGRERMNSHSSPSTSSSQIARCFAAPAIDVLAEKGREQLRRRLLHSLKTEIEGVGKLVVGGGQIAVPARSGTAPPDVRSPCGARPGCPDRPRATAGRQLRHRRPGPFDTAARPDSPRLERNPDWLR
jgi:hypothetical protein